MSVKIEGIDRIMERLDDMADLNGVTKAVGKSCALVERSAKQKAPKGDSGNLRKSIESKVDVNGREIVGTVFTPLEYAPFCEFGTGIHAEKGGRKDVPWFYKDDKGDWHATKGMKPQPFMRPAINENREKIVRLLREGMK